jgi:hypothetical protein
LESRLSRSGTEKQSVSNLLTNSKFDGRVALMLENASNISHLAVTEFAHSIGANDTICRSKGE